MANKVAILQAWLLRKAGPSAGQRRPIRDDITRVGRGPDNDVIVDDAATVSLHHVEIRKEGGGYRICDLSSTNGTFVNGWRVTEAPLEAPSSIQLGATGPEFSFLVDDTAPTEAPAPPTLVGVDAPPLKPTANSVNDSQEQLLSEAVSRARHARHRGFGNQTTLIMREMLSAALNRTRRKFKTAIAALLVALVGVSASGYWKIQALREEKRSIDSQIAALDSMLQKSGLTESESDKLADRVDQYENQGRALESTLLYRVTPRQAPQDPVEAEIVSLMAEFGAETYAVPPEFVTRVKQFVKEYQGPNRAHMEAALGELRGKVATIRKILQDHRLPPDLAYVALVESAVGNGRQSSAGAAGVWQFTPLTAKAYGLAVGGGVDERLDIRKSTQAACKLLRDLILDFGAGSSVMLALAAYNSGSAKVKQGIRKAPDPIKQRNFWYLYRVRAIPLETRQYVPKVIAAMIIARNPGKFGF
jgi:soluble lytic murein transglycosylase-like protein